MAHLNMVLPGAVDDDTCKEGQGVLSKCHLGPALRPDRKAEVPGKGGALSLSFPSTAPLYVSPAPGPPQTSTVHTYIIIGCVDRPANIPILCKKNISGRKCE